MNDCIFCKITNKEIPSTIRYEDENYLAFDDIDPKADLHILIIPRVHIESVDELNDDNISVVADLTKIAKKLAKENKVKGYKLLINVGKEGGQIVFHLHMHLLGYN